MQARLAVLSALEVVAFAGVLLYFLRRLVFALDAIGGAPDSYSARIRFGLRAIETQTGHLPKHVGQLNEQLETLAEKTGAIDAAMGDVASALARKGGQPA
jgi:hypothetical protein